MPIITDLLVDQFGAFVSKYQGRLRVTQKEQTLVEAPIMHLQRVVITGRGVSLSSDAIAACCREGIPIHFLDTHGRPYAGLYAAGLTGTVLSRREQLAAYLDERGLAVGRALARAKIANQAALLRYIAKYRKDAAPDLYEALRGAAERVLGHQEELSRLEGTCVDVVRERLLSIEGRAAHYYWKALEQVLPEEYGWPGRVGREAQDPINAALNYGYGILYSQIERVIILAGLDPYAGYIHADRPGKPSLVYDLIEPFRVPVVDRTVVAMANRHMLLRLDDRALLDEESRRGLAEQVLQRLEKPETYEGKRVPLRIIIQEEARRLTTYLRKEREAFEAFVVRW
ncbi:MAG TPA: CRISPR-associated endonuclease Cas1 [Chloroflexi bacterium]|jgi:CRISPR-associated protein Cas1|nr:CRISPR-associated endonuclease Cas1 [Chloroflexota bacterium]